MLNCPNSIKAFSLVAAIILLSSIAAAGGIRNLILAALVVSLDEYGAQLNGTSVSMGFERAAVAQPSEDIGALVSLIFSFSKVFWQALSQFHVSLSWSNRCSVAQVWEHFSMNF
jgi:hypothetical protein